MPDDETIEALRAELARRDQVEAERHQALLDAVANREGTQFTEAQARQAMRDGYGQTEAAREAKKAQKAGEQS
jgi:hypothetical protein